MGKGNYQTIMGSMCVYMVHRDSRGIMEKKMEATILKFTPGRM